MSFWREKRHIDDVPRTSLQLTDHLHVCAGAGDGAGAAGGESQDGDGNLQLHPWHQLQHRAGCHVRLSSDQAAPEGHPSSQGQELTACCALINTAQLQPGLLVRGGGQKLFWGHLLMLPKRALALSGVTPPPPYPRAPPPHLHPPSLPSPCPPPRYCLAHTDSSAHPHVQLGVLYSIVSRCSFCPRPFYT